MFFSSPLSAGLCEEKVPKGRMRRFLPSPSEKVDAEGGRMRPVLAPLLRKGFG